VTKPAPPTRLLLQLWNRFPFWRRHAVPSACSCNDMESAEYILIFGPLSQPSALRKHPLFGQTTPNLQSSTRSYHRMAFYRPIILRQLRELRDRRPSPRRSSSSILIYIRDGSTFCSKMRNVQANQPERLGADAYIVLLHTDLRDSTPSPIVRNVKWKLPACSGSTCEGLKLGGETGFQFAASSGDASVSYSTSLCID
jgi:hypothetical protein